MIDNLTADALKARMSPGYTIEQAAEVLVTAQRNPGVRVAFDRPEGGTMAVYWDEATLAYWPTMQWIEEATRRSLPWRLHATDE